MPPWVRSTRRRLDAAEPAFQEFVEPVDVEVDAAVTAVDRVHAVLARLPLKPNRYCATRRIWTSSVPSVMR